MKTPFEGRLHRLIVLLACLAGALFALAAAGPAHAAGAPSGPTTPGDQADYVCTTRTQLRFGARCSGSGPGGALAALAKQGMITTTPLPVKSLDPSLSYLPFTYIRLSSEHSTALYGSPRDAREEKHPINSIDPGYDFVSYSECQIIDKKAVYMIAPGVYMPGGSDCGRVATSDFQGLAFYRTPDRPFGWVLGGVYTVPTPGETQKHTGHWVNRYQVVQIYDTAQAGGTDWYEIAPDEWLEARLVAKVTPDTTRPDGVEADRWISINLFEQTLAVYDQGQLVFATLVSSGLPGWWTRPGNFQVYSKLERDDMTGAFAANRSDYYYLQDVPWVLYFDQARAMHGAYWHNGFGYPRSHGCVNLSPTDAHWLYDWASEGTWVHVWDPSGRTPTEAKDYGSGGA